jgi:LmbE family N-acetylglucosaminyl deacetylase
MVIVAHSDDEVLGCGGSIYRHIQEGDDVKVIYMTPCISSRGIKQEMVDERKNALDILGVKEWSVFDFPDQMLDTIPLLSLTKAIEAEIKAWQPDLVYTHHHIDPNRDHFITSIAVVPAVRQWRSTVKEVRLFEIPPILSFEPNLYLDIDIDKKLDAFDAYESEKKKWPDPRSRFAISVMAAARGTGRGGACEAFQSIRSI